MRTGTIYVALLVVAGCGAKAKPAEAPDQAHVVTLAVLPAESAKFPHLVDALNASLARAKVNGVGKVFTSKVSLEVVQLSIECIEASAQCVAAVGKSLAADRLLYAQIEAMPQESRAKAAPVKVKVTLFDVTTSDVLGEAMRTFPSEDDAVKATRDIVDETISVVPAQVREAPVDKP
jgi:hypothetical protein